MKEQLSGMMETQAIPKTKETETSFKDSCAIQVTPTPATELNCFVVREDTSLARLGWSVVTSQEMSISDKLLLP